MELKCYSSTRNAPSWASVKFTTRESNETKQWRGQCISDVSDQKESPRFRAYSTEGLAGDNSPFSESRDPGRASPMKHVVIPKPRMFYAQHTGQGSHHDAYLTAQVPVLTRRIENGVTAFSFVNHDLNKFHAVSDKMTVLSLKNQPPLETKPCPPSKKHKRSADTERWDEENITSAFKVFTRNNKDYQFNRIKERNKNLPPPPPLVKAIDKMRKHYDSKEEASSSREIVVICDSPPPRHPLRASKPEVVSSETFLGSKPISSTRVNTMEYQQPAFGAPKHYNPRDDPRDERIAMEVTRTCHCHHFENCTNLPVLAKTVPQFSNSERRRSSYSAMPFSTQKAAMSLHTGVRNQSDHYHNRISCSPPKKRSRSHGSIHSRSHRALNSPSPTQIVSSPRSSFSPSVTHEASQTMKLRSQLTESHNCRMHNSIVVPDIRGNSKKYSTHALDCRSPPKRDISSKETRVSDDHASVSPVVSSVVMRSQSTGIQTTSEYSSQKNNKLSFVQKILHLPNNNATVSKLSETQNHLKSAPFTIPQQTNRILEEKLSAIQTLSSSHGPTFGVSSLSRTQVSKHTPNPPPTLLLSLLSSNSQTKNSLVVTDSTRSNTTKMSSALSEPALTRPRMGYSSLQSPRFCNIPTKQRLNLSGDSESTTRKTDKNQPKKTSQAKVPCSFPNRDHRSFFGNEKAPQKKKSPMTPQLKSAQCPPNLGSSIMDYNRNLKESENQTATSSQPTASKSPLNDGNKASLAQTNNLTLFCSPPHPRRLSYPLENNRFDENSSDVNPNAPLRRTMSEGEQKSGCHNEVSPLLENFREEEVNAPQPCGGYAFDHDSLPIIVAVHSIVVENDGPQEIENSQKDKTEGEIPKEVSVTTSSRVTEDTHSSSKKEYKSILPKPDTSEHQNLRGETNVSARENQDKAGPIPSTAVKNETTVDQASTTSFVGGKQTPINENVGNLFSADSMEEQMDQAKQATDITVNTVKTELTSVCTETSTNDSSDLSHKSAVGSEDVETKTKTPKSLLHRRHSVEELSNKIVETRERIGKEEIDWKKKLLRRLEFVLIKKLKKAEKETGEKASIDLPPEKNSKSKEEQKKPRNCKRNKSCSEEPSGKVEQTEKDLKEKSDDSTQKTSDNKIDDDTKSTSKKRKKTYLLKHGTTFEIDNNNIDKESTSENISGKEAAHTKINNKEDVDLKSREETDSNKEKIQQDKETNKNEKTIEHFEENCNEIMLSTKHEFEDEIEKDYCDLVIVE